MSNMGGHGNVIAREIIDTVQVVNYPCARLITLNRPNALNALSLQMAQHILWLHLKKPHPYFPNSAIYILKGAGAKSFCAGGDVHDIVGSDSLFPFLRMTYRLNYHILTMPNPQVSLWNGYVMGGGVGISVHGRYRVASERAVFAMPETAIGMFPDNGMTFLFPRLPFPGLGLYLGLTGARVKGADLVHTGLATHYVPSDKFGQLEERLCHIDDPSKVEACLDEFAMQQLPQFTMEPQCKTIEEIFTLKETTSMEYIMDALSANGSDFAKGILRQLQRASPTCLKITLKAMQRGAELKTMRDAMSMEDNLIQRIAEGNEFNIGVKALLIDKTMEPQWNPKTLQEVTPSYLEYFFSSEGLLPWDPESEP